MIYATYPVLLLTPQNTIDRSFVSDRTILGSPVGIKRIIGHTPTRTNDSFTFLQSSDADRTELRDFFIARKGAYGAFWLPSWSDDLTVATTATTGATTLTIDRMRYTEFTSTGHLIVRYPASDFATAVTASATIDDDTEALTVSAIPANITPTTRIQTLKLVRFADDSLTFDYAGHKADGSYITTASLKFVELPRETP